MLAAVSTSGCTTPPSGIDDGPPTVEIQSPPPGAVYEFGGVVQFSGTATDPEDGLLPDSKIGWRSTPQGQLGNGRSFSRSDLQVGPHEIRLTGVDSENQATHAYVTITILPPNQPPTAAIQSPQAGQVFQVGQQIQFSGTGSDAEEGVLGGGALTWTSSIDGQLGTGSPLSRSNLTPGSHEVTLTARDMHGATGSANVAILVNAAPAVTITSPPAGATYQSLQAVTFAGSGVDPEDGTLPVGSLRWTSSIDGDLGTGTGFTRVLSSGTHVITLTGTDSQGGIGSQQISITVAGNQPPQVAITSPAHNSTYTSVQVIAFAGSANDLESGILSGNSLVWRSSVQNQIGTGTAFSRTLSPGTHVITLEATDPQGTKGTAQITVNVQAPNAPPNTPIITSPSNGALFVQGNLITFNGSATDPEDGTLSGGSLVWMSSINGPFGTSTSTSSSTLSVGTHTISLRATDSQGLSATRSIQITVEAPVSFSGQIVPLLRNTGTMVVGGRCTDCHFTGNGAGAPAFDSNATVYTNVRSRVNPPSTTTGALLCKITNGAIAAGHCAITGDNMSVVASALNTFLKWIQQGALNN